MVRVSADTPTLRSEAVTVHEVPPPLDKEKVLQRIRAIQRHPRQEADKVAAIALASRDSLKFDAIRLTLGAPHSENPHAASLVDRYVAHGWDIMTSGRQEPKKIEPKRWHIQAPQKPFVPTPMNTQELVQYMTTVGGKYIPSLKPPARPVSFEPTAEYAESLETKGEIAERFVAYLSQKSTMFGEIVEALTLNLEKPDILYAKIGLVGGMLPFIHPLEKKDETSLYTLMPETGKQQRRKTGRPN